MPASLTQGQTQRKRLLVLKPLFYQYVKQKHNTRILKLCLNFRDILTHAMGFPTREWAAQRELRYSQDAE